MLGWNLEHLPVKWKHLRPLERTEPKEYFVRRIIVMMQCKKTDAAMHKTLWLLGLPVLTFGIRS